MIRLVLSFVFKCFIFFGWNVIVENMSWGITAIIKIFLNRFLIVQMFNKQTKQLRRHGSWSFLGFSFETEIYFVYILCLDHWIKVYLFVSQRLKDIISWRINSVSVFFISLFFIIKFKIKDDEEINFFFFLILLTCRWIVLQASHSDFRDFVDAVLNHASLSLTLSLSVCLRKWTTIPWSSTINSFVIQTKRNHRSSCYNRY